MVYAISISVKLSVKIELSLFVLQIIFILSGFGEQNHSV